MPLHDIVFKTRQTAVHITSSLYTVMHLLSYPTHILDFIYQNYRIVVIRFVDYYESLYLAKKKREKENNKACQSQAMKLHFHFGEGEQSAENKKHKISSG